MLGVFNPQTPDLRAQALKNPFLPPFGRGQ